jgi:aconitate hydratase
MITAGLVAKKAVERGLSCAPWVKTSLAPGSRVVTEYLAEAGLLPHLEALGFHVVGYGCTTCIGNSGPLPDAVSQAIREGELRVASVLSGNRNFEGRVHPEVQLNFLASPGLVVAYALAGTVTRDATSEPIALDPGGNPCFLRDVWPSTAEVSEALRAAVSPAQFTSRYAAVFEGDAAWRALAVPEGQTFEWAPASTYVRNPPFFDGLGEARAALADVRGARCLALLGDSVTTDHISPAGNIAKTSPAAAYLAAQGVERADFNSYGARRGNHEVMMRGTFANIRLRNQLVPGVEGGVTKLLPEGTTTSLYDAAMTYRERGTPLVILAGQEYGTGSSRDWAAKGTALLGVRAVIARSFERIHRSNLVGMGVLPLELGAGESAERLGLTGEEVFDVLGIAEGLAPKKSLTVRATAAEGRVTTFSVTCRIDTPNELDYYLAGGILPFVLLRLATEARGA